MSSRSLSIWRLSVIALAVLVVAACNGPVEPTDMPTATSPVETPTAEPTPTLTPTAVLEMTPDWLGADPCSGKDVSCEPRELDLNLFRRSGGGAASGGSSLSVYPLEELLENGRDLQGSPAHIVTRGSAVPGSTRCDWHGYASTAAEREADLRFWLDVDPDAALPTLAEAEKAFAHSLETQDPPVAARFRTILYGGLSDSDRYMSCAVDYRASEYILGDGPAAITIVYYGVAVASSYDVLEAKRLWDAEVFGQEPRPISTEEEYESGLVDVARETTTTVASTFGGRESVLFLAPIADQHFSIALEGWMIIGQWDLQQDDNGTVNVVRYGALDDDPEHTQTLANLKNRVTTAAASDDHAGKRIANITGLTQFYRDIGAYDDITPGDGVDNPFTPAQPPPACGLAVPDQATNPGLMADCMTLLAAKDTLRGTAMLNWSVNTPIAGWDGVTVRGTPSRVAEVGLRGRGLTGVIPAQLGDLTSLTRLRLGVNQLTGTIPAQLGELSGLLLLNLSNNQLSGAIPAELGGLANLTHLTLFSNLLTGAVPTQLGSLANLQALHLSDNRLTGGIPAELGGLSNLTDLYLDRNQLTEAIPSQLGRLTSLRTLSLDSNQLAGAIPAELGGLSNLTRLYLDYNRLTGAIPAELGGGGLSNLEYLSLDANQLTGAIPSQLGSLTNLQTLWLSGNGLTGCIPSALRSVPANDLDRAGLPYCAPDSPRR